MHPTATEGKPGSGPMMDFYRSVLEALDAAQVPFLVGGAYALELYAGIEPHTKDLDVFVRREHLETVCKAVSGPGCRFKIAYPHWLAKIYSNGAAFVDVIFGSGNGYCVVDEGWFEHARHGTMAGRPVLLCPPEEMIWSKAFIMERERFDGADIIHFLRLWAAQLDWTRLLNRFGPHWRVLFSHVVLFGYAYPHLRSTVPDRVLQEMTDRILQEQQQEASTELTCFGTLLSRWQYLPDIQSWGYGDARLPPLGKMSADDVTRWTEGDE